MLSLEKKLKQNLIKTYYCINMDFESINKDLLYYNTCQMFF